MTTTIQVDEKTLKSLMTLKKELKARSYQEVIEILVSQKRGLPSSLFGFAKGSKPFQREPENEHVL
jgi:predicted CopG family antitoxin